MSRSSGMLTQFARNVELSGRLAPTTIGVPFVFAHRGASHYYRDNSAEAFKATGVMGVDGIELDVRRTKDEYLVVYHDPELEDDEGNTKRLISESLKQDLPEYILTLEEALMACEGWVNVEIKNHHYDPGYDFDHRIADQVCEELVKHPEEYKRYIVSCFNYGTVQRVRQLIPELRTAFLTDGFEFFTGGVNGQYGCDDVEPAVDTHGKKELNLASVAEMAFRLEADGIDALHVREDMVTEQLVEACHATGRQCSAWVVNSADRGAELIAMNADGLCTNLPDEGLVWLKTEAEKQAARVRARARSDAPKMLMPSAMQASHKQRRPTPLVPENVHESVDDADVDVRVERAYVNSLLQPPPIKQVRSLDWVLQAVADIKAEAEPLPPLTGPPRA